MRMMHKRLLWAFALVLALSFSYNAQHALAYTGSGSCGAKARWALNDDGILTISGTGPMTDYQISTAPWYAYFIRDNIKQIVIEEGITTVGTYAFMSLWNVTDVYLPSTLKEIHDHGFLQEKGLERIHFSEGLETIGEEAFMDCESLIQAELPHSLLAMGSAVFKRCLNLSGKCDCDSGKRFFPMRVTDQHPHRRRRYRYRQRRVCLHPENGLENDGLASR